MGGMPGIIAKVPITKRIDDLSRTFLEAANPDDAFQAFLNALEQTKDYVQTLVDYGVVLPREEQHLRNHWFDENGQGWWKEAGPVKEIHRRSLIEAFREAQRLNRPIDSYWICAAHRSFVVAIGWNEEQVTRLIISPPVPEHEDPRTLTQPMDILIVKRDERRLDEIIVERNNGEGWRDTQRHRVQSETLVVPRDEESQVITVIGTTLPYSNNLKE